MKNFFKKLAFVLSLAMIIASVAPAAKVSAAEAPSLKVKGKVLYIGGDVSEKYDDNYRFYFNNAVGYTATWESLNPEVAIVKDKRVYAVAPGRAELVATLTNKAGDTVVCKPVVVVKQNADEVGFGSKKKIENGVSVGDEFKINVYRKLEGGKAIWSQTDFSTITDKVIWTSSDDTKATVDKWGIVTALAAGEVTITASATQSYKSLVSAEDSYTFVIKSGITDVKQISTTKAELTFAAPVSADDVNKDTITYLNSKGINNSSFVKSVTLDDTKTVATVEVYVPFTDKEVYTFSFEELDTAIDMTASVGDIVKVVITGPKVVEDNVTDDFEIQGYDANGVKIDADLARAEFTLVDSTANAWINGTQITVFTKGTTVAVKGTYKTGKYDDNYDEITIDIEGTVITCVDSLAATVKSIAGACVSKDVITAASNFTSNMMLPLDTADKYVLYIKSSNTNNEEEIADATFESTNSDKLIVDPATGELIPLQAGKVGVIVTVGNLKDVFEVTVGAKEALGTVVPDKTKVQLSNSNVDNKATFTFTTKSNYNNDFTVASATANVVSTLDDPVNIDTDGNISAGKVTFEVDATDATKGTHAVKVNIDGKTFILQIVVAEAAEDADIERVALKADGATSMDTTIKSGSTGLDDFKLDFSAYGYVSTGAAKNMVTATGVALEIKKNDTTIAFKTVGETGMSFPDGGDYNNVAEINSDGKITVHAIYGTGLTDGNYKKLPTGTYTITGYVYYDMDANVYTTDEPTTDNGYVKKALVPIQFTVTDAQPAVSVEFSGKTAEADAQSLTAVKAAVAGLLTAKNSSSNGSTVAPVVAVGDCIMDTTYTDGATGTFQVYLKSVNVLETLDAYTIKHTVVMNQVFTVTVK